MNILENKLAKDPYDKLIFEQGIRAKNLFFDKDLDLMLVALNNGKVLHFKISDFPRLQNATFSQLSDWTLEQGGIAVSWEELNENLSVKGFLKQAAMNEVFYHLAAVA